MKYSIITIVISEQQLDVHVNNHKAGHQELELSLKVERCIKDTFRDYFESQSKGAIDISGPAPTKLINKGTDGAGWCYNCNSAVTANKDGYCTNCGQQVYKNY